MSKANLDNVMDYLRRIVGPPVSAASDHVLVARFLENRDEAAFAALLKRHGLMVFRVCRRLLLRELDAEDVVQAAFLLLARKAGRIRKHASLGCWLHGVAHRLSLRLKRQEMNRLKREQRASAMRGHSESPHTASAEIQELLGTALQALPEKNRAALILCCLEGRTQEEAARQLGCPLGTLQSRLARGRTLLQKQLEGHGLTLSAAGLASFLTAQNTLAALPIKLFGATLKASIQYASGKSLSGLVSASVALLVNNGLKSLALTKLMWISLGIITLGLVVGGTGVAAKYSQGGGQEPTKSKPAVMALAQKDLKPKAPESEIDKPRVDLLGDSLPPEAIARLGTTRLRHGNTVNFLDFSPDEKTILSADGYGVYFWDANTGKLVRSIVAPGDRSFQSSSIAADKHIVATSTGEGIIEIWDATNGKRLRQFQAGRFPHLVLSPDGKNLAVLESGVKDAPSMRILDAMTGEERHRLTGHQDTVHSMVFSKDSKTLISSSDDKSIRFWEVDTGKQIRQFDHTARVGKIVFAPDGKTLASVDMIKTEFKHEGGGRSITWLYGEQIFLWEVATGKIIQRLEGKKNRKSYTNSIYLLGFAPDSRTFVASDWKTAIWWDVATGKELKERNLAMGGVNAIAFTHDGRTLATGGAYGSVQLWDMAAGKQKLSLAGHQASVFSVAISPDGRTFATGGGDDVIRLWDAASGEETGQMAGHEKGISSLAFSPDGQMLVSTGWDETVRVWELATGKEHHRFQTARSALSPDAKLLLTDSKEKTAVFGEKESKDRFIRIWDIATCRELRKWPSNGEGNGPLAFSYDSRSVYSWDADKKVRVWEVATGKELRHFEGKDFYADSQEISHQNGIFRWATSPDRKLMALGSQFGTIGLFDMETGKQIRLVQGIKSLSALAFSADSSVLASGDWVGGKVHLWEVATGLEFRELAGHKGRVLGMAFSADGKVLVSGNADTTALVWDLTGTRTGPKAQPLTSKDLEIAWSELAGPDATRGQKAVRTLLAVPEQTVALVSKRLKPAKTPEAEKLAKFIADLDSDQFKTREQAIRELENLGEVIAPTLRKAIAGSPSLETKLRIEKLLDIFSTSQRLRTLRAVQVLEQVDTPSSQEFLARLADGVPEALLTRVAKAAVDRFAERQASGRR